LGLGTRAVELASLTSAVVYWILAMLFLLRSEMVLLGVLGSVATLLPVLAQFAPAAAQSLASKKTPTVAQAQATASSTLNVQIDGLRNTDGQVCVSLYSKPESFPKERDAALQSRCVKITANPMQVTFRNLKPGNYAIAMLHDANGNGKDDRNFIGMPTEGFGFSKNPVVRVKAPSFSDAAFAVEGTNTNIKIQVQYLTNR
jgi:uncharacterized protein (DUF2141 family)